MNPIPTQIREYLSYDPETGIIRWIKRASRRIRIGDEAGNLGVWGYKEIRFKGSLLKAHRIAWYLYYGEDPGDQIDHINGKRDDNRISNIRVVNNRINCQNMKKHRAGKLVGAYSRGGRWESSIYINGRYHYLGRFSTEHEAHEAYVNKLKEAQ